mmetsp:Transcript_136434/g.380284  ORF Transcript_136434/g.380284 Transcript_136434/m.380284 type:complete len:205 (-) Transcript_136434:1423-2037(-)
MVQCSCVEEDCHSELALLKGLRALITELCNSLGRCAGVLVCIFMHVPVAVQRCLALRDELKELAGHLSCTSHAPHQRDQRFLVLVEPQLGCGTPQPALRPLHLVDGRIDSVLQALLPVEELAVDQCAVGEKRRAMYGLQRATPLLEGLAVERERGVPVLILEGPVPRLLLRLPTVSRLTCHCRLLPRCRGGCGWRCRLHWRALL